MTENGIKDITEISKHCLDDASDKVKRVEKALDLMAKGTSIQEIVLATGLSEREVLELQGDY